MRGLAKIMHGFHNFSVIRMALVKAKVKDMLNSMAM